MVPLRGAVPTRLSDSAQGGHALRTDRQPPRGSRGGSGAFTCSRETEGTTAKGTPRSDLIPRRCPEGQRPALSLQPRNNPVDDREALAEISRGVQGSVEFRLREELRRFRVLAEDIPQVKPFRPRGLSGVPNELVGLLSSEA